VFLQLLCLPQLNYTHHKLEKKLYNQLSAPALLHFAKRLITGYQRVNFCWRAAISCLPQHKQRRANHVNCGE
jgi:hypothetical protein